MVFSKLFMGLTTLVNGGTKLIGVNYPLPTDGDSVYSKDIWADESNMYGFSGNITDIFDNLHSVIIDTSATNPKKLLIHFNRTIITNALGIGANTGNFSNVKVIGKVSGSPTGDVTLYDDSANNDDMKSDQIQFPITAGFNAIEIQFHTADPVSISNLVILKTVNTVTRMQGKKPDGTITDFNATAGGNFKVAIEEFDEAFYETPLPVTNIMLEIPAGRMPGKESENKYGKALEGIQTTKTDIWDRADAAATQQIWVAPTQARQHVIASTNINDTGGGTGARTVKIWGLINWDTKEVSETVTMDTGSPPLTINSYVIIHRKKVMSSGAAGPNLGIITATAAVDSTVTSQINIGKGQTNMTIYGIPSVQRGFMTKYSVTSRNSGNPSTVVETDFELLINEFPKDQLGVFINKSNQGLIATGSAHLDHEYLPFKKITGPAIIKFQAISTLADTTGTADYGLILEDNV